MVYVFDGYLFHYIEHGEKFKRFDQRTEHSIQYESGSRKKLTDKQAYFLKYLLERANEPVSEQDILDEVWAGAVVSDRVLPNKAYELRQLLPNIKIRQKNRAITLSTKVDIKVVSADKVDAASRIPFLSFSQSLYLIEKLSFSARQWLLGWAVLTLAVLFGGSGFYQLQTSQKINYPAKIAHVDGQIIDYDVVDDHLFYLVSDQQQLALYQQSSTHWQQFLGHISLEQPAIHVGNDLSTLFLSGLVDGRCVIRELDLTQLKQHRIWKDRVDCGEQVIGNLLFNNGVLYYSEYDSVRRRNIIKYLQAKSANASTFHIKEPHSGKFVISPDSRYMALLTDGSDAQSIVAIYDLKSHAFHARNEIEGSVKQLAWTEAGLYLTLQSQQVVLLDNESGNTRPIADITLDGIKRSKIDGSSLYFLKEQLDVLDIIEWQQGQFSTLLSSDLPEKQLRCEQSQLCYFILDDDNKATFYSYSLKSGAVKEIAIVANFSRFRLLDSYKGIESLIFDGAQFGVVRHSSGSFFPVLTRYQQVEHAEYACNDNNLDYYFSATQEQQSALYFYDSNLDFETNMGVDSLGFRVDCVNMNLVYLKRRANFIEFWRIDFYDAATLELSSKRPVYRLPSSVDLSDWQLENGILSLATNDTNNGSELLQLNMEGTIVNQVALPYRVDSVHALQDGRVFLSVAKTPRVDLHRFELDAW